MSHVVIEQVYSTLMALDPDAKPYPELAESYEVSPDGLTYTFKLRQGVKFHNGDELTAEDVKFSFDRLRAKDFGYSYGSQVETIGSVDVVDPHTVRFKLSQPTGPFLVYMAFPGSSIVPKKLVEIGPRPQRPAGRHRARSNSSATSRARRSSSSATRTISRTASPTSTRWSIASSATSRR